MSEHSPTSVGLGGDGDEIHAINDVERAFGVKLNYADAPHWETAGDVFTSLQQALPEKELACPDLWQRFAIALSVETGIDPSRIQPNSLLLSESRFWARLADASAMLWIIVFITLTVAIGIAAL